MKRCLFAFFTVLFCSALSVNAQIINVQIGSSGTPIYTGLGADPNATGITWNIADPVGQTESITNVATEDGTVLSGVDATITNSNPSNSFYNLGSSGGNLFSGYAYIPASSVATYTLTGLDAYDGDAFSLYLIGGQASTHGSGRETAFTLDALNGGGSATAFGSGDPGTTDAPITNFVEGEQFVLFQGTVVNGQVSGTASLGVGSAEADFNGLQLDIQSVPEPSTCAMMFVATILLALRGNRKPFSCGHKEKAVRQQ